VVRCGLPMIAQSAKSVYYLSTHLKWLLSAKAVDLMTSPPSALDYTIYYVVLVNGSGDLKLITVSVGRPHSSFFPAPNLAVRYGFTPQ